MEPDDLADGKPIDWCPKNLVVGDCIGCLVSSDGSLFVFQNGQLVAREAGNLPTGVPVFAVVDLIGRVSGVRICAGARPQLRFGSSGVLTSPSVVVSEDRLHVESRGEDSDAGLAFCNSPLVMMAGYAYFEVQIEATCTGFQDGIVLGVTMRVPENISDLKGADQVPYSWTIGYDGRAFMSEGPADDPVEMKSPWCGKDLAVGDRVGLLWSDTGELIVFQNGERVGTLEEKVLPDGPIYPFVDLLGNTKAISVVPDAKPPTSGDPDPWMFSGAHLSKLVSMTEDGSEVRHSDPTGNELQGVAFSRRPIPIEDCGDAYFEVSVTQIRDGEREDGMAIGVTRQLPNPLEPVTVADELPDSGTFGYDGMYVQVGSTEDADEDVRDAKVRFKSKRESCYFRRSCARSSRYDGLVICGGEDDDNDDDE